MVRPIVIAKETRIPELPEVPTFREMGYNVTFKMFRGMLQPRAFLPKQLLIMRT